MPHYEKTDNGQWTNITQAQAVARERARDDDAWDADRITRWMRRIGPLRVAWLVRTCGYVSERSRHVVVRSHTVDQRDEHWPHPLEHVLAEAGIARDEARERHRGQDGVRYIQG